MPAMPLNKKPYIGSKNMPRNTFFLFPFFFSFFFVFIVLQVFYISNSSALSGGPKKKKKCCSMSLNWTTMVHDKMMVAHTLSLCTCLSRSLPLTLLLPLILPHILRSPSYTQILLYFFFYFILLLFNYYINFCRCKC